MGQLLLSGLAGLTQVSPVDIKQLGGDDSCILAVFGQDCLCCPQKLSILCIDSHAKIALEQVIAGLCPAT